MCNFPYIYNNYHYHNKINDIKINLISPYSYAYHRYISVLKNKKRKEIVKKRDDFKRSVKNISTGLTHEVIKHKIMDDINTSRIVLPVTSTTPVNDMNNVSSMNKVSVIHPPLSARNIHLKFQDMSTELENLFRYVFSLYFNNNPYRVLEASYHHNKNHNKNHKNNNKKLNKSYFYKEIDFISGTRNKPEIALEIKLVSSKSSYKTQKKASNHQSLITYKLLSNLNKDIKVYRVHVFASDLLEIKLDSQNSNKSVYDNYNVVKLHEVIDDFYHKKYELSYIENDGKAQYCPPICNVVIEDFFDILLSHGKIDMNWINNFKEMYQLNCKYNISYCNYFHESRQHE